MSSHHLPSSPRGNTPRSTRLAALALTALSALTHPACERTRPAQAAEPSDEARAGRTTAPAPREAATLAEKKAVPRRPVGAGAATVAPTVAGGTVDAPTPSAARPVLAVPRPRERIALRFLGALPQAVVEAPRLWAAAKEIAGRAMMAPDPLSRLPARLATLARKVTFPAAREKGQWEMRESLFAPPPFKAGWSLVLPAGARLSFDLPRSPGVSYAIEVESGGETQRLFSRDGASAAGVRVPWTAHTVDLGAYAGKQATVRFVTDGRGPAFFGAPRLYAPGSPDAEQAPPSVLLIAIDTLTAEAVGFSGSKRGLSPVMDKVAGAGAAFPQALTNANWTRASTVSMFGSEYSTTMGINVHSWWLDRARRAENYQRHHGMLPELLKRAGYQTAAIVNNLFVLGYHSAGVEVGFEEVTDFRTDHRDTPDVTEATLAFLKKNKDRPFFLFMNLNTPHHPYTPPPQYLRGIERPGEHLHPDHKKYLGEVKFADDYIGRVMRALEQHGMRERTLVILTSDHGEGLREDVAFTNLAIGRYSRFTHTVNMYDEVTRVPLSFTRPADIPAGRVLKEQVRLLDVAPTILGLVGLPLHPQHRGVDLSAAILGHGPVPADLPAYIEGKKVSSLRWKGYKYVKREPGYERISRKRDGVPRRVPEELYALAQDPRELRDLAASKPELLRELRAAHQKWQRSLSAGVLPAATGDSHATATSGTPAEAGTASQDGRAAAGENDKPPNTATYANSANGTPAASNATGLSRLNPPSGRTAPVRPARTYLLVASDRTPHVVSGSLRARGGKIVRYRMQGTSIDDAIWPAAPDRLDFSFRADGGEDRLYVQTEPPGATLELEIRVDDRKLGAGELGVGPFGLPLVDPPFVFGPAELGSTLWAQEAPPRQAGVFGVLVWREGAREASAGDPNEPPAEEGSAAGSGSGSGEQALEKDVEDALRGWGYIQKGDKVLK